MAIVVPDSRGRVSVRSLGLDPDKTYDARPGEHGTVVLVPVVILDEADYAARQASRSGQS